MPDNYFKMKVNNVEEDGDSEEFHQALKKRNNLIKKKFGNNDIVIAAPHHAPKGQDKLPSGRVADNNAGYFARNVADHIRGKLVVGTKANKDPNKTNGTYHKHTVGAKPKVLVEIHGHKGGRNRPYDVEISCGAISHTKHAERIASRIKHYLKKIAQNISSEDGKMAQSLRNLTVNGNYNEIIMKASNTKSIADARREHIMPYHIELRPDLRLPEHGGKTSITKKGMYVSRAIAAALADVHKDVINKKSRKLEELLE